MLIYFWNYMPLNMFPLSFGIPLPGTLPLTLPPRDILIHLGDWAGDPPNPVLIYFWNHMTLNLFPLSFGIPP